MEQIAAVEKLHNAALSVFAVGDHVTPVRNKHKGGGGGVRFVNVIFLSPERLHRLFPVKV